MNAAADSGFRRSRLVQSLLALAVIAIGLASRRGYVPFPAVLGNYPGDALWAWVVLLCGGDKTSQRADIKAAQALAKELEN